MIMATAMTPVPAAAFQLASREVSAYEECIVFSIAGRMVSLSCEVAPTALDMRGPVLRPYGVEEKLRPGFGVGCTGLINRPRERFSRITPGLCNTQHLLLLGLASRRTQMITALLVKFLTV